MIDRDLDWQKFDLHNPPSLTEAEREQLRRLAESTEPVDTSDIPEGFQDPANPPRRFRDLYDQRRRAWNAKQAQTAKAAAE